MTWTPKNETDWTEYFDTHYGPKLPDEILKQRCVQCDTLLSWRKNVDPAGAQIYKSWCCDRRYTYRLGSDTITVDG